MLKKILKNLFGGFGSWFSVSLKMTISSYCDLETADSDTVFVAHDGSLMSVIKLDGVSMLVGSDEFEHIQNGMKTCLQSAMSQPGKKIQFYFSYDKDNVKKFITKTFSHAKDTAEVCELDMQDLFDERVDNLANYCGNEAVYMAIWTTPAILTSEQLRQSNRKKMKAIKKQTSGVFLHTQNLNATIVELRESHDSFVRTLLHDMRDVGMVASLSDVHSAGHAMRVGADPEFTDDSWKPIVPGDKYTAKEPSGGLHDIADISWPPLSRQFIPRDGSNLNLRTAQLGDRLYATIYVDLFPYEVQAFSRFFSRIIQANTPWRLSFMLDSSGVQGHKFRQLASSILGFTSAQNRLISKSLRMLSYINTTGNDAIVRLHLSATTWAPVGEEGLLRIRASLLAKAVESWGSCHVSEVSGDPFAGMMSTTLGLSAKTIAPAALAPLSSALYILPWFRPSSPWKNGAVLLRSPDGKLWPYQPGSSQQTTWIDLFYARPGSGKSVLSNAINLAVILSAGLKRLPRIAIIDIGPSSSGLISLLEDSLPVSKRHLVAHHRLRMLPDYAINPFDTQLGARLPTPQERSFLVNFLTLLATPVGHEKSYDGVADMVGLIIDELYHLFSDSNKPNLYAVGIEPLIDGLLEEIGFSHDAQTTWWEVTDSLFTAGFSREAIMAQRHAVPVLPEVLAVCRGDAVEDLYGDIRVNTGELLLQAFSRLISSAIREYPIISQATKFDFGEAKIVALDLDEVARSGGDAANRQTAIMYMLARYVLAKDFYLTHDSVKDIPPAYQDYHQRRITEIREDPKRIVFDEFHRTAKIEAVRNQVVQDMREGRKWKVQIALASQSLDDFDEVMVEFATSVFIMDAGPEQALRKTAQVFGLTSTAKNALRHSVHGPSAHGATFLAQFATKDGINTQLLTATLGPIELWSLSTTVEDVQLRTKLYHKIGGKRARAILARKFPRGSAAKEIEERYVRYKEEGKTVDKHAQHSIIDEIVAECLQDESSSK